MKPIRVLRRSRADQDIDEALQHYLKEGGAELGLKFIDALETGMTHIAAHPNSGSPHYATELNLPGLRAWTLRYFPYLIFYVHTETHLDVWRVLHAQRDIPAYLQTE